MSKKTVSGMLLTLILIVASLLAAEAQIVNVSQSLGAGFIGFDLKYYGLDDLFSSLNVSGTVILCNDSYLNAGANSISFSNTSVADLSNLGPGQGNWSKTVRSLEVNGTVTLYEDPSFIGRTATFTSSNLQYEDIGTEWNANPYLIKNESDWDQRVWHWDVSDMTPEISNDSNNYVNWTGDGSVQSQINDMGGRWIAVNFDQGYERDESEIYSLVDYRWNDLACSLRVEGNVTLFEDIGYGGSNMTFSNQEVFDLGIWNWSYRVSSLKLAEGSTVTLYDQPNFNGDYQTFASPSFQPAGLKVSDEDTITLEGVVQNWNTNYVGRPGWIGAKFDIFAVENRSGTGKVLMLEMYFLRSGMNLIWSGILGPIAEWNETGAIGTTEWFRPPFTGGNTYNYLIALDYYSQYAQITVYPGNVVKWKVDVKSLIEKACSINWWWWPDLDISKLSIVKVSFTLEASTDFFESNLVNPATVGCTLNSLRLAYTAPTHAVSSFYYFENTPRVNETVTFDATSSYVPGGNYTGYAWDFGDGNTTTTTLPIIDHTYTSPGNYTVTLNATTDYGLWNTTSHQVLVTFKTDVNRDGKVDLHDLTIIAAAYGSKPGDPNWNAMADVNGNGKVDLIDLVMVGVDYGKTV